MPACLCQGRAEIKKMITAGASGSGGSNGSSSGSSEGDVAADRDAFAARCVDTSGSITAVGAGAAVGAAVVVRGARRWLRFYGAGRPRAWWMNRTFCPRERKPAAMYGFIFPPRWG